MIRATDQLTLVIILVAGICIGLLGLLGLDVVTWAGGEDYKHLVYDVVGVAAVWQLFRQ